MSAQNNYHQAVPAGAPGDGSAAEATDLGFDTDEGNAAMLQVLSNVAELARGGELDRRGAVENLADGLRDVASRFPEAAEMPVRTAVVGELDPLFAELGWEKLEPGEF